MEIRIRNGLKQYGLQLQEVLDEWHYDGGSHGEAYKHFLELNKDNKLPQHESECICGINMYHNYYLRKDDNILIVCSVCLKTLNFDYDLKCTNECHCIQCYHDKKAYHNSDKIDYCLCHNCEFDTPNKKTFKPTLKRPTNTMSVDDSGFFYCS